MTIAQTDKAQPLLLIEHATVMRGDKPGLKDFSLRVERGESLAILGPNGSGKSTLLKLIGRELYPLTRPETRVELLGQDAPNIDSYRRQIGIISQDLQTAYEANTPGLEVVISGFFGSNSLWQHHQIDNDKIKQAVKIMQKLAIDNLQDQPFGSLSTGQQRRLLLARALVHNPDTLILDEPTTGLDLQAGFQYLELVEQLIDEGKALILVTHHLHEIPAAVERVVLLKQGAAVFDGPKTQALTDRRLSEVFATPVHLIENRGMYQAYRGAD